MNHNNYMRRCLQLAQQGKGYTAPNPMVGAVLVHNDQIIGEGWHHEYGKDHAEVDCLNNVAADKKHLIAQSTMYVTLEPCAHYGNTPPCATRLVQEQVKKVIIANKDPFDKVSGRGIEILHAGGIATETGIMEQEGTWVNRRFFCFHEQKRPYVVLKWAETADGFIAPADRSRLQITGQESQRLVHKWRTEEAAIMVGTTTALNDNPHLTARLYKGKQPLRIVADRKLRVLPHYNLFNGDARTWVVNEIKEDSGPKNISHIKVPFDNNMLRTLLSRLFDERILSVIIEGGAELLNSFISQGLWDEARIFTGNIAIQSGIDAPMLDDPRLAFTTQLGNDTLGVYVNPDSRYPYAPGMEL